jgi:Pilus assembly protein, PilO
MTSLNLSGRVAALLAGAAVLVVLIAGWLLLVSPQRSKAADISAKTAQTQAQVVSTQAYIDSPSTRRAVQDLKRLQAMLPDDPKMSQILRQLSAAAGTAGIALNSISPGAAIPSSGGEAVPISLAVTGHYFNISRFLDLLRAQAGVKGTTIVGSGRLYSIDSIQFSGGGAATAATGASGTSTSSGGPAPISASLALNAFIYSPVAATPPVAATTTPSSTTSTTTTTTGTSSP